MDIYMYLKFQVIQQLAIRTNRYMISLSSLI